MPKKHLQILVIFSLIYLIILSILSLIKYYNFLYPALDLAIFTNILFNLKENLSLYSSIQGHTYLGDHFTPIIIVLIPLFTIAPHAITLLIAQTLILAGISWLVYKTIQIYLETHNTKNLPDGLRNNLPLLFALFWLINPLVWNANLFEFHLIIFAPIFIFLSLIFYWQNKFNLYTLSLLATCLVREDLSLVILMMFAIAWIDKKPWKYRLTPLFIGIFYFVFALYLLGENADGSFRFIAYYSWLGESIPEIIINIFTKPLLWIKHILTLSNLNMLVGLLFPFLFLPLRRPKYLLLGLLSLIQFILGIAGGSNVVVETHYALLFTPSLFIASLEGLINIFNNKKSKIYKAIVFDKQLTKIVLIIFFALSLILMSPIRYLIKDLQTSQEQTGKLKILQQIIKTIPRDMPVTSSYNTLPQLSARENISTLHYIFLGHQQLSVKPYVIRENPELVIMNVDDFNIFDTKSKKQNDYPKYFHDGIKNLQNFLINYTPTFYPKGIIIWTKANAESPMPLSTTSFPEANNNLQCNSIEHGFGFTVSCSIIEPIGNVYWLYINNEIIPFVWRDYSESNQNQKAYARFMIKKSENNNLKIELVTKDYNNPNINPWINNSETIGSNTIQTIWLNL